jgi:hypothetical protein
VRSLCFRAIANISRLEPFGDLGVELRARIGR